jgi:hypothetical protein
MLNLHARLKSLLTRPSPSQMQAPPPWEAYSSQLWSTLIQGGTSAELEVAEQFSEAAIQLAEAATLGGVSAKQTQWYRWQLEDRAAMRRIAVRRRAIADAEALPLTRSWWSRRERFVRRTEEEILELLTK